MPNLEPVRPDVFRIAGNDWEKCHWAGDNYLYLGHRRLYEGPKWIGDDFEIRYPPSTNTACSCVKTGARAGSESS